jgi:hypothetical protein
MVGFLVAVEKKFIAKEDREIEKKREREREGADVSKLSFKGRFH